MLPVRRATWSSGEDHQFESQQGESWALISAGEQVLQTALNEIFKSREGSITEVSFTSFKTDRFTVYLTKPVRKGDVRHAQARLAQMGIEAQVSIPKRALSTLSQVAAMSWGMAKQLSPAPFNPAMA